MSSCDTLSQLLSGKANQQGRSTANSWLFDSLKSQTLNGLCRAGCPLPLAPPLPGHHAPSEVGRPSAHAEASLSWEQGDRASRAVAGMSQVSTGMSSNCGVRTRVSTGDPPRTCHPGAKIEALRHWEPDCPFKFQFLCVSDSRTEKSFRLERDRLWGTEEERRGRGPESEALGLNTGAGEL